MKAAPKPRATETRHYAASSITQFDRHLANRIKVARTNRQLSRARCAQMLGISDSQLEKWEAAENRVFAQHIWQIAVTLEVPPGWFYEGFSPTEGFTPPPADDPSDNIFAQRLIASFKRMSPANQHMVRQQIRQLGDADEMKRLGNRVNEAVAG